MTDDNGPTLLTERLVLRRNRAEDFAAWESFHISDRSRYVGGPSTSGAAWRALAAQAGHWSLLGYGPYAIERRSDGAYVGQLLVWSPADWPEDELGWYIWEPFEGEGYAYEAAVRARRHAYDDLGWTTAVSYIDADNARSRRLAERLGAVVDPDARSPNAFDCLVYRHPGPGDLQPAA